MIALPAPQPRPLTADDIFYLLDAGVIDRQARFELIDGEIVPMSPKGRHHEIMREHLADWIGRLRGFHCLQAHTLVLADGLMLEPDFILYDAARRIADAPLKGADLRLVIEVADSSLAYDLDIKAPLYAAHGVEEYWVIDAVRRTLRAHRQPFGAHWTERSDVAAADNIAPLCAPDAEPLSLLAD